MAFVRRVGRSPCPVGRRGFDYCEEGQGSRDGLALIHQLKGNWLYMSTDSEWEKWGRTDPYFGVLTNPKFRKENITDVGREEFFVSGEAAVDYVLRRCGEFFGPDFAPLRVLDYGCGVGRLVIPFSRRADEVVGLDVSRSMLSEAADNCQRYGVDNVTLSRADDSLSLLQGGFDLIHSFIVFQHVPVNRGREVIKSLLRHLNSGGVCALQVTYAKSMFGNSFGLPRGLGSRIRSSAWVRRARRWVRRVARMCGNRDDPRQRHRSTDPEMQMNSYNLNEILFLVQSLGVKTVHADFTDHSGNMGVYLFFRMGGG